VYRERGELLFLYEPTPRIPQRLYYLFATFELDPKNETVG
jgi:hypothetical protein